MHQAMEINAGIDSVRHKLLGYPSAFYVAHCMNRAFRGQNMRFNHMHDRNIQRLDYAITGQYDMSADMRYITFIVNHCQDNIEIAEHNWAEFRFLLSQVIQHESIHRYQYSFRDCSNYQVQVDFRPWNMSSNEEQEYLCDMDEIEAYAHDIAMEISYHYPKRNARTVLRNIDRTRKLWSYNYYRRTFRGHAAWPRIKTQLLRKTYKWLPYIVI